MATYIIRSRGIYTPKGPIDGGILIKEKTIEKILKSEDLRKYGDVQIVDVGENIVIPGLIDIHIHGSGGWAAGAGDEENIKGLCKYLPSVGVTSFQPTLGGENLNTINESLKSIAQVKENGYDGAKILGIHMEGPFLNPEKNGAFVVENLLKPSMNLMKTFIENSNKSIIHVTVAPEIDGAKNLIEFLVQNKILVAGGHTNATSEETKKGIEWGISLSTHTCNAQRSIHHREPGALGAYLLADNVYCELICDFFHVHPDMIKLISKIKSIDKICMISDSIIGAGLRPGKYNFSDKIINIDSNGWSKLPDGTISGSTKSLLFGFKNMINLGYSIEDVIKMSSYIPARLSKIDNKKGSIEEGKDADLTILNSEYSVVKTYIEGKLVFKEGDSVFLNDKLNN